LEESESLLLQLFIDHLALLTELRRDEGDGARLARIEDMVA
jgi:hypothetical protein